MYGDLIINFAYLLSAILFVLGLKLLSNPKTAGKGNLISAWGMLIAIVAVLISQDIIHYTWIVISLVIGSAIGVYASKRVQMTSMPEMVALLNGFGGLSSLLVGWAVYHLDPNVGFSTAITIYLSILIGGVTFSGSVLAWAKLSEKITGRPLKFVGQNIFNFLLISGLVVCGVLFSMQPAGSYPILFAIITTSFLLGIMAVLPIGRGDMPVVISLLNSYSGLAACATGFVIQNYVLIVSGALVGASGIILTSIMCKSMNRSLKNVLFSGFGSVTAQKGDEVQGEAKSASIEDLYFYLEAAKSVVIVPGYGLAVAQAQHVVKELGELFEKNGCDIKYAIHPVAGRMPGHMNVLLAEAGIPYDQLVEMDDVNQVMESVDACLVIGANDVVNPDARENKTSPIYGMPIINVDKARQVYVFKRSMASGFAGIQNPLFFKDNTNMIFGDAKQSIHSLVGEFKD